MADSPFFSSNPSPPYASAVPDNTNALAAQFVNRMKEIGDTIGKLREQLEKSGSGIQEQIKATNQHRQTIAQANAIEGQMIGVLTSSLQGFRQFGQTITSAITAFGIKAIAGRFRQEDSEGNATFAATVVSKAGIIGVIAGLITRGAFAVFDHIKNILLATASAVHSLISAADPVRMEYFSVQWKIFQFELGRMFIPSLTHALTVFRSFNKLIRDMVDNANTSKATDAINRLIDLIGDKLGSLFQGIFSAMPKIVDDLNESMITLGNTLKILTNSADSKEATEKISTATKNTAIGISKAGILLSEYYDVYSPKKGGFLGGVRLATGPTGPMGLLDIIGAFGSTDENSKQQGFGPIWKARKKWRELDERTDAQIDAESKKGGFFTDLIATMRKAGDRSPLLPVKPEVTSISDFWNKVQRSAQNDPNIEYLQRIFEEGVKANLFAKRSADANEKTSRKIDKVANIN